MVKHQDKTDVSDGCVDSEMSATLYAAILTPSHDDKRDRRRHSGGRAPGET